MVELKLVDVLATLAVILLTGTVRMLMVLRDDVRTLRIILVGEKGDNGIKSQVTAHGECIDELRVEQATLHQRVNEHDGDLRDLRPRNA